MRAARGPLGHLPARAPVATRKLAAPGRVQPDLRAVGTSARTRGSRGGGGGSAGGGGPAGGGWSQAGWAAAGGLGLWGASTAYRHATIDQRADKYGANHTGRLGAYHVTRSAGPGTNGEVMSRPVGLAWAMFGELGAGTNIGHHYRTDPVISKLISRPRSRPDLHTIATRETHYWNHEEPDPVAQSLGSLLTADHRYRVLSWSYDTFEREAAKRAQPPPDADGHPTTG